jgi:MFS family permease
MARTKFTGHTRDGILAPERVGLAGAVRVFRGVSRDRVLAAMIVLAGLGAFFVGSALQTAMPAVAAGMADPDSPPRGGTAYSVLLFANGLGGVLGGLVLEGTGWFELTVRSALWTTLVYGATSAFFALSHDYLIAAPLLIIGGIANLAALSITQTVVQLRAPREKKGQVIGVYGVGANGMRIDGGFTVGCSARPSACARRSAGPRQRCAYAAVLAGYLAITVRRGTGQNDDDDGQDMLPARSAQSTAG